MTETTLIAGALLPDDGGNLVRADILVRDGMIVDVSAGGTDTKPEGARIIDATGRMIIPGLVNSHSHSHLYLAKGMADEWNLELHLNAGIYTSANQTADMKRLAATLCAAELVLKGCTATFDMYADLPSPSVESLAAVAEGYRTVGMKAVVAPLVADRLFWDAIPGLRDRLPDTLSKSLQALKPADAGTLLSSYRNLLAQRSFNDGHTRIAIAPIIPLHCSDELLVGLSRLAEEFDTRLHIHLAESKVQALAGLQRYGLTLTRHLDRIGILNSRLIAGHAVWLDDDDIRLISDRQAQVTHNPTSNLRLGSGLAPIGRMLELGVNVGLGTDTPSCSDDMNMFFAMRSAAYINRSQTYDVNRWLDPKRILKLATSDGEPILGMGRMGKIAVGFPADIVFLNMNNPNWTPVNDALAQLVFCENGTSVESVMVNGKFILKDRSFVSIDFEKLQENARDAVLKMRESNAERKILARQLESTVRQFSIELGSKKYHVARNLGDLE